jgi:hypothetical protein
MTRCDCDQCEGVQCPRCEDYVTKLVRDYAGRLVCGECEATASAQDEQGKEAKP